MISLKWASLLLCSCVLQAAEPARFDGTFQPPTQFWQPETFLKLSQSNLAYIDVPKLRSRLDSRLDELNDHDFRTWFLDEVSYISAPQLSLNGIRNTPIQVREGVTKIGYRTFAGGRSSLLPLYFKGDCVGWIDLKGNGLGSEKFAQEQATLFEGFTKLDVFEAAAAVNQLRDQDHSDGLVLGAEGVAELSRQRIIQALLNRNARLNGLYLETVETLALVDPNFDVLRSSGNQAATLIVREAHWGRFTLPIDESSIYDALLGGVQSTATHSFVDFGATKGAGRRAFLKALNLTEAEAELLKRNFPSDADPQRSPSWIWGGDSYAAFRRGNDPDAVARHLSEMLGSFANEEAVAPTEAGAKLRAFVNETLRLLNGKGPYPVEQRRALWEALLRELGDFPIAPFQLGEINPHELIMSWRSDKEQTRSTFLSLPRETQMRLWKWFIEAPSEMSTPELREALAEIAADRFLDRDDNQVPLKERVHALRMLAFLPDEMAAAIAEAGHRFSPGQLLAFLWVNSDTRAIYPTLRKLGPRNQTKLVQSSLVFSLVFRSPVTFFKSAGFFKLYRSMRSQISHESFVSELAQSPRLVEVAKLWLLTWRQNSHFRESNLSISLSDFFDHFEAKFGLEIVNCETWAINTAALNEEL